MRFQMGYALAIVTDARYTALQRHQGYDGLLHGGVVTALLDEAMGWAIFHQGIWGVTAKINVTRVQGGVTMGRSQGVRLKSNKVQSLRLKLKRMRTHT